MPNPSPYHGAFRDRSELQAILGADLPDAAEVVFAWMTVTGRGHLTGAARKFNFSAYWTVQMTEHNVKLFGAAGKRTLVPDDNEPGSMYDSGWVVDLMEMTNSVDQYLRELPLFAEQMRASDAKGAKIEGQFDRNLERTMEEAYLYMIFRRDNPSEDPKKFKRRRTKRVSGLRFEKAVEN